ncbi:competence type IV pilus minor pilin ComGF [Vagococcus entomophilus]|uniref:Competence protein ComGF n=1 Tax=Vagococcus entomophilus TaxID=1160095 RepID=A0A430AHM0_9ENTE|nr:competence type IV pilus minor pilin ComGF [Vagococcus entomophilus]RSU07410.1 hypothetical protein CBF30_07105 [Vagococcus entomophilus]
MEKTKFPYNYYKLNKGFTLLEALISLFLFSLVVSTLPPAVQLIRKYEKQNSSKYQLEWHVFLAQMNVVMTRADTQEMTVIDGKLVYYEKDKIVKIEHYKKMLRRVKNGGHEPLLLGVKHVKVEKVNAHVFQLEVEFIDGTTNNGRWTISGRL